MPCKIIVVANAKGGSGKSTTAMHIGTRLLQLGYQVGCIDLDVQQHTLQRYIDNRIAFEQEAGLSLPIPQLWRSAFDQPEALQEALTTLKSQCDFVVVDSPGFHTPLMQQAHIHAQLLITPINDSFIDVDILAQLCPNKLTLNSVGWYAEMVWQCRKQRYLSQQRQLDWVIVRNRVAHVEARNKRAIAKALQHLAPRLGFRVGPGLGERVIFRELFLRGLTLSDSSALRALGCLNMQHLAAHDELRALFRALRLPSQQERHGATTAA